MSEYNFAEIFEKLDTLAHYGTPRHSGRYPYGSGKNPYQHGGDLESRVRELKLKGFSEKEIADTIGMSTGELRTQLQLAKHERRNWETAKAKELREQGYSLQAIADELGYNSESSVRQLFREDIAMRKNQASKTAEFLKKEIDERGPIDVGAGVEIELGISKAKLQEALLILEEEGYPVYGRRIEQVTNRGKHTTLKVICPPGTEQKELFDNLESINSLDKTSHDGGETFVGLEYPSSMSSKRLAIRYREDGGEDKDGVIELRRGVDDLSLGNSQYAQVRILVDGKKYIKGMAVYSDDLPDGVDVLFNTNKSNKVAKLDVLKDISDDPDNPFGSLIKANGQSYYTDAKGNKKLSLINKRAEEGDWGEWSKKLPSQFLSKQNISLIKKQLSLAEADKQAEFDEIMRLTNPTVKKKLLSSFADDCDSAAVHLQAASLPRQKYQVILPVPSMKDNECYAPNYRDGEQVALIRFPHGGTFEIPILTVNNKQKDARDLLGTTPKDAVAINKKVADRLSGADFDGDTVLVIPTNRNVKITSTKPLDGLKDFDPKMEYGTIKKGDGYYDASGKKIRIMSNTQNEMGKISNLITDMTLKGATTSELARAVRHSMVVIDAEKHKLNYKQSEADNGIAALKRKYQGRYEDGKYTESASTLISRAKAQKSVPKRKGSPHIDPETGEVWYNESGETRGVDKKGNPILKTQKSTQMAETRDARTLSSGTPQEEAYAAYANSMKALANKARKTVANTGDIAYSKTAAKKYEKEVKDLNSKLTIAQLNAPKERKAQIMANVQVSAKKKDYPDMTKAEIKKESQRALTAARLKTDAHREPIKITDSEWQAIQSGAISKTRLKEILKYTDVDEVRRLATPKQSTALSSAQVNKITSMKNSGYTTAQIAESMGISTSTVSKYLN